MGLEHRSRLFRVSKASTAEGKRGAFVDIQGNPVSQAQLQDRMHNDKKRDKANQARCGCSLWPGELIKEVFSQAKIASMSEQTFGQLNIPERDIEMVEIAKGEWLDESDEKERMGWVFTSYAVLDGISRVVNPGYIKLCGDGAFRTVFANWCILFLGFLSKHYGRTNMRRATADVVAHVRAWPTHFNPLVWVVASGETAGAYRLGIDALLRFANTLTPRVDLALSTKHFHADLTATAEKARRELLKHSVRVAYF